MADSQQADTPPPQSKEEMVTEKPVIKPLSAIAHRMFHPPKLERNTPAWNIKYKLQKLEEKRKRRPVVRTPSPRKVDSR
ncbi:hypothetical protein CDAR_237161 [Caerostris darwini]|uniref:Uncharacterized protein n=1 Tax=Caerostris darwini TaxID=1538125 RepID=A0AAV4W219_9ARAC|nr:hypothetical protein CDAR_237161 [Caerostris darwini]